MEFVDEIKIPKERLNIVIGTKGKIKKKIEESTHTKIEIHSDGDVFIHGNDGLDIYLAKNIIHAIGRGFNPEIAFRLLKENYVLDIVDISQYGKTKNARIRLKGRVIGREGKSRKNIERLTETAIEVYGKTVSIIGESQNVVIARKAIEMLLEGAEHSTVYRYLEKVIKKKRFQEMLDSFTPRFEEEKL